MEYLLQQIWICLGLITLIAGLAGWFLRGGSKGKIKAIEDEWNVKLARAENERDYYAGEVKSLSAMAEDRENREQTYQNDKQALSVELENMRTDLEMTTEAFKDQERLLKQQAIELEASQRTLLEREQKEQQVDQITSQLEQAEEKISDLQTELDSIKIQLLDTTDKLSITEDLLAESQNRTAQEGQTILLVKDKEDNLQPSPSPIQKTKDDGVSERVRYIPEVGRLLATPTSSVEIVDAHDKGLVESVEKERRTIDQVSYDFSMGRDHTQTTGRALDDAFSTSTTSMSSTQENKMHDSAYKSATLAGAGAAALGMAGKMKEKLSQVKEDLLETIDLASDVYMIRDIHTISREESKALKQLNILSTEDMINECFSKEGVERVAKSMGKESWLIRSWVSMADLMRVEGVDSVNAELLELSGISSVQTLASAKVEKLTDSIKVIHKHVGKTDHVPEHEEISIWIKRAGSLPKRLDNDLDKL